MIRLDNFQNILLESVLINFNKVLRIWSMYKKINKSKKMSYPFLTFLTNELQRKCILYRNIWKKSMKLSQQFACKYCVAYLNKINPSFWL